MSGGFDKEDRVTIKVTLLTTCTKVSILSRPVHYVMAGRKDAGGL